MIHIFQNHYFWGTSNFNCNPQVDFCRCLEWSNLHHHINLSPLLGLSHSRLICWNQVWALSHVEPGKTERSTQENQTFQMQHEYEWSIRRVYEGFCYPVRFFLVSWVAGRKIPGEYHSNRIQSFCVLYVRLEPCNTYRVSYTTPTPVRSKEWWKSSRSEKVAGPRGRLEGQDVGLLGITLGCSSFGWCLRYLFGCLGSMSWYKWRMSNLARSPHAIWNGQAGVLEIWHDFDRPRDPRMLRVDAQVDGTNAPSSPPKAWIYVASLIPNTSQHGVELRWSSYLVLFKNVYTFELPPTF